MRRFFFQIILHIEKDIDVKFKKKLTTHLSRCDKASDVTVNPEKIREYYK